ncbi:MAG: hypothetical protein J6K72_07370 [Clostridia bacterium]|nr:hypothetical protein [Clostridia bacterium]
MKKSTLLMVLSLVLALTIGLGTTLAYLTDTDADVNVMTLGNVDIIQNEQERDENGELQAFTPNKPLYPAVGTPHHYVDETGKEVSSTGGAYKFLAKADGKNFPNAQDKIVTVKNIGKSDAYVRTIIAFEVVDDVKEVKSTGTHIGLMRNDGANRGDATEGDGNTDWYWSWLDDVVTIDEKNYAIAVVTHKEVLEAGDTTIPSLLQVYLKKEVDNEYVAKLGETYDILVLSQAVQTAGFDSAEEALNEAFPMGKDNANVPGWFTGWTKDDIGSPGDEWLNNNPPAEFTGDPAELEKLLTEASDAGSGNVTIELTESYDMTGYDWTPVTVDGYHGADIVTINGNGNYIKGLNAPLYGGGFAGGSGIVINDLTIIDADMTDEGAYTATGYGAFVCAEDSMDKLELNNCHLINSKVSGGRTGGLVGWTSGYNVQSDGPVDSYITIKNCSVVNCEITGKGTVGAINGHAGCNPATYTTIENCTVKDCVLTSYDDSYRVGVAVGTANVGEVTISNITASGNTIKQINGSTEIERPEGQSDLYGRFVPNSTGKLVIDGEEIK